MASLTDTAYIARKSIRIAIISILLIAIARVSLKIGLKYWRISHPEPPPPANVAFGKLPPIKLDIKPQEQPPSFIIEPLEKLPQFPDKTRVYFIPPSTRKYLALSNATDFARRLGFFEKPNKLNDSTYQWTKQNFISSSLTINIFNNNFKLETNWQTQPAVIGHNNPLNEKTAIEEAKQFLSQHRLMGDDLPQAEYQTVLLQYSSNSLKPVASLSQANFIRIIVKRPKLNNLPFISLNKDKPPIYFLYSGLKDKDLQFIEINYQYFKEDNEPIATYPIKDIQSAIRQLETKQAIIINNSSDKKPATIRSIYLSYPYPTKNQQFLTPFYIFEGENNFLAVLPAITKNWLEQ